MNIKILGMGCPKCNKLEEITRQAVKELAIEADFEKVKDLNEIMSFGVMVTPALVIDGVVKLSGRVPDVAEIKKLIQ